MRDGAVTWTALSALVTVLAGSGAFHMGRKRGAGPVMAAIGLGALALAALYSALSALPFALSTD